MKKLFAMLLVLTMCAALTSGLDTWAYADGMAHGAVMYTSTATAPDAPSGMQWVLTGQNTDISIACAKPVHTHSIENGCYARKSGDSCHVHSRTCYTHVHDEGCCSMENQGCPQACGLGINCGIGYQHVHDPKCGDGIGGTHARQIPDCKTDACTNIPNSLICTQTEKECDANCYDTSTPICAQETHTHGNCATVVSSYRWQLVDASALKAGDVLATANNSAPTVTPQGYHWGAEQHTDGF